MINKIKLFLIEIIKIAIINALNEYSKNAGAKFSILNKYDGCELYKGKIDFSGKY